MTTIYQDPLFLAFVAVSIAYIGQLIQSFRPYQITIVQTGDTFTPVMKNRGFGQGSFGVKRPSPVSEVRQIDKEMEERRAKIRESIKKSLRPDPQVRFQQLDDILLGADDDKSDDNAPKMSTF